MHASGCQSTRVNSIILSATIIFSLEAILPTLNILQMHDTFLQWMKVNRGCLLLHPESNADPMCKAKAKSAFLKPTNSKSALQENINHDNRHLFQYKLLPYSIELPMLHISIRLTLTCEIK